MNIFSFLERINFDFFDRQKLGENRSENFVFIIDGSQTMFAKAVSRVFSIIAFFDMKMPVLSGFSKI